MPRLIRNDFFKVSFRIVWTVSELKSLHFAYKLDILAATFEDMVQVNYSSYKHARYSIYSIANIYIP